MIYSYITEAKSKVQEDNFIKIYEAVNTINANEFLAEYANAVAFLESGEEFSLYENDDILNESLAGKEADMVRAHLKSFKDDCRAIRKSIRGNNKKDALDKIKKAKSSLDKLEKDVDLVNEKNIFTWWGHSFMSGINASILLMLPMVGVSVAAVKGKGAGVVVCAVEILGSSVTMPIKSTVVSLISYYEMYKTLIAEINRKDNSTIQKIGNVMSGAKNNAKKIIDLMRACLDCLENEAKKA